MRKQGQLRWQRWLTLGVGIGLINGGVTALPGWSAERLTVSYGALERSIDIDDLELFAKEGHLTETLQSYARYFDPQDVEQFRQLLNQRAPIDVKTVDRFLYTTQGEYLLNIASEVILTAGHREDYRALRGALIVSAADQEEGLTLLNFMRNFPTRAIQVDLAKGFAIAREVDRVIYQTNAAVEFLNRLALQAAEAAPLPEAELQTIEQATQSGPYGVERVRIPAAAIPTEVYVPFNSQGSWLRSRPAVLISHGFGNDLASYRYLANHLASYGFVVIAVEHPGSSAEQFNALLTGRSAMVIPNDEFIQRPAQISNLLDDLEQRARTSPRWRGVINFQRIGIVGQSFGGYTALALAGAPIDFSTLRENCPPEAFSLNISLLLQCQASVLSESDQALFDLSDNRIQAVIAINPITSVLFGQNSLSKIQSPTLIVSSGADTVAPALAEQLLPFTWLTTPHRYLLTMPLGTHFSVIGPNENGSEAVELPPTIIGQRPDLAQTYIKAVSLSFFATYLMDQPDYQTVLTSAAIITLSQLVSQNQLPLSLVQAFTVEELNAGIADPLGVDITSESNPDGDTPDTL
jgi:predicted dienelactone hydrolase